MFDRRNRLALKAVDVDLLPTGFNPAAGDEDPRWIWESNQRMQAISWILDRIADCDVSVLIAGESGVGKGVVAQALHRRSTRRTGPFVHINCAALPDELVESELFGHETGAFTGATRSRTGKFEQAEGGTLLLDEIADMKPALQAKLLHVLQDGEFSKLGSNRSTRVNVRVVAATNHNLEQMRSNGTFREDLYYRLAVIELMIPPLRERREEISPLTDLFVWRCSRQYHRPLRPLSAELRQMFGDYHWPGNIRELENVIRRVVVTQDERQVKQELHHKMARAVPTQANPPPLSAAVTLMPVARAAARQAERAAIAEALHRVRWNRRKAAKILGVSYKTLLNKIRDCGIDQT